MPGRVSASLGIVIVLGLAAVYFAVNRQELYTANLEWARAVLEYWAP